MTAHVMRSFGASVDNVSSSVFTVENSARYIGRSFAVEGDASSATYFFAAAAVTGGTVSVKNLPSESLQGDLRFLGLLHEMGCTVVRNEDSIEVRGGKLFGIEASMNDIPDCVPTLAVIAAFAKGTTTIQNIGHLRHKETDRLLAIAAELRKLGAGVELFDDGIAIHPRALHGAEIETYNDHRIAMSFAVAGLAVPGIRITNPSCVSKSFPDFWDAFALLERKH
jgi:3-phosphoshikimate 1-carboxyvinyltransferase